MLSPIVVNGANLLENFGIDLDRVAFTINSETWIETIFSLDTYLIFGLDWICCATKNALIQYVLFAFYYQDIIEFGNCLEWDIMAEEQVYTLYNIYIVSLLHRTEYKCIFLNKRFSKVIQIS